METFPDRLIVQLPQSVCAPGHAPPWQGHRRGVERRLPVRLPELGAAAARLRSGLRRTTALRLAQYNSYGKLDRFLGAWTGMPRGFTGRHGGRGSGLGRDGDIA